MANAKEIWCKLPRHEKALYIVMVPLFAALCVLLILSATSVLDVHEGLFRLLLGVLWSLTALVEWRRNRMFAVASVAISLIQFAHAVWLYIK